MILSKLSQQGRFAGYYSFDSGVNFVEQDDGWNDQLWQIRLQEP